MEKSTKLIHSRKLALALNQAGFPILDIIENRNKRFIDIYVFEDSGEFQKAFTNLVNIPMGGNYSNGKIPGHKR